MDKDIFLILLVGPDDFEAHVRLGAGAGEVLTGKGFKNEAAAREWVTQHAPNAIEVSRFEKKSHCAEP